MIDIDALKYIVDALTKKQKYKEAHELLDFFADMATTIPEFDGLGAISIKCQHHKLRLRCANFVYTKAVTTEQLFAARENLYTCYNTLNMPEKALFYIELNLLIKPNDSQALQNKAFNLALIGKRTEAENIIFSLIKEDNSDELNKNLEFALSNKFLREGETNKGLDGFINSFKPKNNLFENVLKLEFWNGQPAIGRTIIVSAEGGTGDELINIRFMDYLKELGMRPILYSSWVEYRPDTVDLFRRHGHEVVCNTLFFEKDCLWTNMMSLPVFLKLKESDLWRGKYLTPLKQEKNKLTDNNFKIGIKCRGNPYFEQDIYRTIPIDEMIDALPKNASIYYFDMEYEHDGTISLKDKIKSWDDTLDYIDQMDVIVSSCTSLVHAAGAIGKNAIVCVPIAKYYTWTSTRNDETTPWYGNNLKVIEQTEVRSWKEPLERVSSILKGMM